MAAFSCGGRDVVSEETGGRARGCGCGGGCFCGDRPFAEGFGFEAVLFLRAVSSVDKIGDGDLQFGESLLGLAERLLVVLG
jgi:hypothetical protein